VLIRTDQHTPKRSIGPAPIVDTRRQVTTMRARMLRHRQKNAGVAAGRHGVKAIFS
jgi:hypothetical protein